MIDFHSITPKDSNEIEAFTSKFEPYSDFNFTSIYSWSLHSQSKFCITNDCLYLMLPDYITQKPMFSLLTNNPRNVISIIEWQKLNNIETTLRLVPENLIYGLTDCLDSAGWKYFISEDEGSFDYILDTKNTIIHEGKDYSDFRYKLAKLNRMYGTELGKYDFSPKKNEDINKALNLAKLWAINKTSTDSESIYEMYAFSRFLHFAKNNPNIKYSAITNSKGLVGFSSYEVVSDKYAIGHFIKYDQSIKGLFYRLVYDSSLVLAELGVSFLNIEQDLGILHLRESKKHLRPIKYLKKYSISVF